MFILADIGTAGGMSLSLSNKDGQLTDEKCSVNIPPTSCIKLTKCETYDLLKRIK